MSEMIERAAKAFMRDAMKQLGLHEEYLTSDPKVAGYRLAGIDVEAAMRAAIGAMREPTERLSYIGGTAFEDAAFGQCKLVFDGAADAWRVMIDEACKA